MLYFGKSAILSRTCFVIFGNENNIFHSDGFGIGYNLWYAEKKGFFKWHQTTIRNILQWFRYSTDLVRKKNRMFYVLFFNSILENNQEKY